MSPSFHTDVSSLKMVIAHLRPVEANLSWISMAVPQLSLYVVVSTDGKKHAVGDCTTSKP